MDIESYWPLFFRRARVCVAWNGFVCMRTADIRIVVTTVVGNAALFAFSVTVSKLFVFRMMGNRVRRTHGYSGVAIRS